MLTVLAPAKLNLVLEVVGRHGQYHDIRSIAQGIDLCDMLTFEPATDISFTCSEPSLLKDNLVSQAARLLQEHCAILQGARIHLNKRIPQAAGLGGGSSDAAATLLALNQMWGAGLQQHQLFDLAAQLGSDVPLFVTGGTVLLKDKGDQVRALPHHPPMHAVILTPCAYPPPGKTGLMYSQLHPEMFTKGQFVRAAEFALEHGRRIPEELMFNVFEKVADCVFESLARDRTLLQKATDVPVHLAGSGPSLYVLLPSADEADAVASRLIRYGRHAVVARTIGPAA